MMNAARGIFLAARRKPRLPYDAEVEYLESTGTQWIDTGVIPNQSSVSEIKCQTDTPTAKPGFFFAGARKAGLNNSYTYQKTTTGFFYSEFGLDNYCELAQADAMWHVFRIEPPYIFMDGNRKTYNNPTQSAFTTPHNFILHGCWQDAGGNVLGNKKIAYFKFSQGGVLVRDMISVRFTNEHGQSEGAMYDRVSGQLFRNAGTGAFLYGADKTA